MAILYENLSFTILTITAVSLLIFGILQNATATGSEIRMLADLNPTNGGIADGRADYRERGLSMRLNVEVEDLTPNITLAVEISGEPLGTIRTNSFGIGELELNTNDGQVVPKIVGGDLVQIFQGTQLVLSGSFGNNDTDIENDGQTPITSPQDSVVQLTNSTSITTVITIPQDADDLGTGAYSPNPASVSIGSTVTWDNIDSTPHTATADDGSFDTGIINGGSSGSIVVSTNSGVNTIPYHCSVHPEMRGILQVIPSSSVPSSNITLLNTPVTATNNSNTSTNSSDNNIAIQNLQQEIVDLQRMVDELQQALMALQLSALQDGNTTVPISNDNDTASTSIREEPQQQSIPMPTQQIPQSQQQQQRQNQTVSIVPGSSTLINSSGFQPDPIQLQVGDTVTWVNDDLQPHTVTSGSNGVPDNKFNSSPNFNPLMTPSATFSHTFQEAGEYPYFCLLHPNMVGTVSVVG